MGKTDTNDKKRSHDLQTLRWMYSWSKGQHVRILFLIVINTVYALLSVGFALVCKGIVDSAVQGMRGSLIRYAVFLFFLIVSQAVFGLTTQAIREYVGVRLRIGFQERVLRLLLQKDYSAVAGFHSGELLNRMFSDVGIVVGGIVSILPAVSYLAFRLAGAAVALTMLDPEFTLLFLAAGVLICLVMTFLRGKLKSLHRSVQEAEGQVRSFLQDTLESMLVVKVFGTGERILGKAAEFQQAYFKAGMKRRAAGIVANAGVGFIFQTGYFLAMVRGCLGILHGSMTYGTLTAMLQLVNQIQSPIAGFSSVFSQIYSMLASAERIMELEALPEEAGNCVRERREQYQCLRGIRFEHVDFTYGRNQVLSDVCVLIEKGDFVSLTGLSGGGKSTLFLLMLGAYPVSAGRVVFTFTEEPCELLPDKSTRQLFAYVPQGNYLLSGTLRENLTFFKSDVEEAEIWRALRTACAEKFVREFPDGLETCLGERGHGLSEGQMQRIAIARALLSGAPILLLDEATSALDEETEAELLRNIEALKNRTCLIVTHRRAALDICNKHLVVKNGRVSARFSPP